MSRRHTQTNEIGRCTVLWLALAQGAVLSGRTRLALFDIGCSAGLNRQVDACRIRDRPPDGTHGCGSTAEGALRLEARSHPHGAWLQWRLVNDLADQPIGLG